MARSSKSDPLEKFRFQVTFLKGQSNRSSSSKVSTKEIGRAGFSEAAVPRSSITTMEYRENIDGLRPIKIPGLASYEPVTLRRGVTNSRELYDWYTDVNNDAASLNKYQEALANFNIPPSQNLLFRREVVISALDRSGNLVKHWVLFNAYPMEYKGADDFNAGTNEKIVEELVIDYESFLEVDGNSVDEAIRNVQAEAEEAASNTNFIISAVTGLFNG